MSRASVFIVALALVFSAAISSAAERATASGNVVDSAGKPLEHATVMVYSAGVKKGYSTFCPTCWRDCGKRTVTDGEGNFTIGGLDPDLQFTFLVVKDGYSTEFINSVDPAQGPAHATLKPRPPVADASQILRGSVVDAEGRPVKDALVQPHQVVFHEPDRNQIGTFGSQGWIDSAAVSDERGEFELAFGKPAQEMTVLIQPRGMAPKLFSAPPGEERKVITVASGALIRGRLMYKGKPVAGAEVGVIPNQNNASTIFPEARIGTNADGTFAFTNVPAGRIWKVYPKMESLAARGIGGDVVLCETRDDGEEVKVGDIPLQQAYTLRGKVALNDGQSIPPHMNVMLSAERAWDSQIAQIGSDGSFEFRGLPAEVYTVTPAVRGYRLAGVCQFCPGVEVLITKDVNDLVVRMAATPK